ncbi:hypothetical protein BST61_g8075 [Cercospora zeina]
MRPRSKEKFQHYLCIPAPPQCTFTYLSQLPDDIDSPKLPGRGFEPHLRLFLYLKSITWACFVPDVTALTVHKTEHCLSSSDPCKLLGVKLSIVIEAQILQIGHL